MPSPDPHGQISLMLCESLLHLLVEEGLITKDKAVSVVETVVEVAREMAQRDPSNSAAATLADMVARRVVAKDRSQGDRGS